MKTQLPQRARPSQFGALLQNWRRVRGKSQLGLALDARVSPRHVSFVETGRAVPSREMVLTLATALNVPLREQNTLLLAAGYAPVFLASALDDPALAPARKAFELILRHQEPHPAVILNRQWDIVASNDAGQRFFSRLLGGAPSGQAAPNVLRLMLDPTALRPWIVNWESVAEVLIQRVHREAIGGVVDEPTRALLAEVLAYPDVPARWGSLDPSIALAPFVPIVFRKGALVRSYFSTITTLGTPQDITLQELRIECFFAADAETEAQARAEVASTHAP